MSEKEVRVELGKALTFKPDLREYFITTTAPDDAAMQQLARELTVDLAKTGRGLLVHIWGWNTLQERISEHADALREFDPSYGVFGNELLEKLAQGATIQAEMKSEQTAGISSISARLETIEALIRVAPGDATITVDDFEAHLDAEIDGLRQLAIDGKPRTAMPLFEGLLARIANTSSGRILFRVKANIGTCLLALGEDARAASFLSEAYDHEPREPKAIANKAFSLLLQGEWKALLAFGADALREDPTNDALAGYVVQAARFQKTIDAPLELVPDRVKGSAAVAIAHVDFLRHRGLIPDWWRAAREAAATHPDDRYAQQFAAEADLDEILRDAHFQRTRRFRDGERRRIIAVAGLLTANWDRARGSEGIVRPEGIALCCNLIMAFHALGDLPRAVDIARQGLAIAPDNSELALRGAVVAIDDRDEAFARELLPHLPAGPDATILRFRFHAQKHEWADVAELCRTNAADIPDVERTMMMTAGRLAEIKLHPDAQSEARLTAIVQDVSDDARASIVAADFATTLGFEKIADDAYRNALKGIDANSHIASRLMTAMHAAKRGEWKSVADLLDGYVDEDNDSEELQTLATALVNDSPIRRRAVRFFERLPAAISAAPFYLHAAGLLHFNRGALKEAEGSLGKAVEAKPDLTNCLALFATVRRMGQQEKIAPLLQTLKLDDLKGTPAQKMLLAHELRAAGQTDKALAYAYAVLTGAKNDPETALRYFGLLMPDTTGRMIPAMDSGTVDAWVRLEGSNGEKFAFTIEEGKDRPGDGVLSPKHPTAAAVLGLKVGASFDQRNPIGDSTTWRIVEIKHKYLYALHDVMENFQTRFPGATGLYRITMREGDIQPALDQVKNTSEANRKLADLYLLQHVPITMVVSRFGGDVIGFAEYIRSLDANIETCVGNDPERFAARDIILRRRADGAALDAYTAWTAATMDIFDILVTVFGKLFVPQSTLDELRILKEKNELPAGRSMTIAWRNGQFFRQEYSSADIEAGARFIDDQIRKIGQHCTARPTTAPDSPTELARVLTESFGPHALDVANLAAEGYILLSEDLYFRQLADAGVSTKGVWLQVVLTFARDYRLITRERYADEIVKLAQRRHSHLSFEPATLWDVFQADGSPELSRFRAVVEFIGTKNADVRAHMLVVSHFLSLIWSDDGQNAPKRMRATGLLLDRIIRHRGDQSPLTLAFMRDWGSWSLREYINTWLKGHFLPIGSVDKSELQLIAARATMLARATMRLRPRRALASTRWPQRD
ncbi:MAG: hypothetical protein ABSC25_13265 [Roseiarcus sp.]